MSVQIRPLGVPDLDDFLRVRRASLLTDPQAFDATPEDDEALDAAYTRKRLGESSAERADVILGAFAPALVGIVGLAPHRAIPEALWLWGFYVAPDHRGAGVGRALLEEAVRIGAAATAFTSVALRVSPRARAALALYERAGFSVSSGAPLPSGKDAIPMTLTLADLRERRS
jgi:ribosomal protein S18 acetylase RimI-like enzyme